MTGTKIVVVVLLLIAVLFVVLIVMGAGTNKSTATADNFINSLGNLLGNFGPKLDSSQMRPSITSFNLESKPNFAVSIAPDTSHTLRKAKFQIEPAVGTRCANLVYEASGTPPKDLSKLKCQSTDPSQCPDSNTKSSDNPFQVSFVVLGGGGTLSITRASGHTGPCTVQLK